MDVLCYIIEGYSVKEIVKKTKQAQSTVSEKIRFLIKNKVIIKNKWKFKPNWKTITKVFQREIKKEFEEPLEIMKMSNDYNKKEEKQTEKVRDIIEEVPNIFNEKRVKKIFMVYADYFINHWVDKMSIDEIAHLYIEVLKRTDTSKFKKFKKDIITIKKLFNKLDIRDMKEELFREVEKR